jgi:cell division control protein 6
MLLVLDDVDRLVPKETNAVIYHLASLGKAGLICISADARFYGSLEQQTKSRFYPSEIEFPLCKESDLADILRHRSFLAFREGAVKDEDLLYVASQSGGNAQIALEILRKAAAFAEQERSSCIFRKHLEVASVASNGSKREQLLTRNPHVRLLYEIIRDNPDVLSGQLRKLYNHVCQRDRRQPVAYRTVVYHLKSLSSLSLIVWEPAGIHGNARRYRVAEDRGA